MTRLSLFVHHNVLRVTPSLLSTAALLNNLVYPHDGDWPLALSLLPFLAQGRALYIVLVYHTSSPEVSGSLLLLFAVGSVTLIIAFLIDEYGSIAPGLAKVLGKSPTPSAGTPEADADGESNIELQSGKGEIARSPDAVQEFPMTPLPPSEGLLAQADIRRELDDDLRRERVRARLYVQTKTAATTQGPHAALPAAASDAETGEALSAEQMDRLAIVLHGMKFRFPVGGTLKDLTSTSVTRAEPVWAVNGMSLALSLGECFGLLGPNGAGRVCFCPLVIAR